MGHYPECGASCAERHPFSRNSDPASRRESGLGLGSRSGYHSGVSPVHLQTAATQNSKHDPPVPPASPLPHPLIYAPEGSPDVGQRENPWRWVDSSDAVVSHGVLLAVLLLGSVPSLYQLKYSQVPYFLSVAALSIYIGSHRSLDTKSVEQVTLKQSLLAPVFASCFLFGFYLLLKYFPGFSLQTLVDVQFGIIGTFSVCRLLTPFLEQISALDSMEITLPEKLIHEEDGGAVHVSGAAVVGAVVGLGCVLLDVSTGHQLHTLNNFIACSLAIEVLQGIGIGSFKASAVLLIGLLMYDVFWVFFSPGVVGENVMLKVATSNSIEGPLKLLLPNGDGREGYPFSILGLGDIAIPGILAALMLRFDAFGNRSVPASQPPPEPEPNEERGLCYTMESVSLPQANGKETMIDSVTGNGSMTGKEAPGDSFLKSRTYFMPVWASYVVGLLLASAANAITNEGQPALLYIVPCMLATSVGIALLRGEFWNRLLPYIDPTKHSSCETPDQEH